MFLLWFQTVDLALPSSLSAHIGTSNPYFGRAVYVWSALNTFNRAWNLFPFSFEDFDQALHHPGPCAMRSEIFVSLLRVAMVNSRKELEKAGHSLEVEEPDPEAAEVQQVEWTLPPRGMDWLLAIEPDTVTASTDEWEGVLRQYLEYMAEECMQRRLEQFDLREVSYPAAVSSCTGWV